jgi:steroid delta-isomerase-like uncharacterized protein
MATGWIDGYMAAWNSRDPDRIASFMAGDATYEDLALGERYQGRVAIKGFFAGMETGFSSDYRFETTHALATDAGYAIEWTMSGTNDRPDAQRGLPATGKPYGILGVSIGTLREGKISENRDYWNLAAYLMEVGLMPAPPSP